MKRILSFFLLASLATSSGIVLQSVSAQLEIRQERVQFKPGANSAVIEGSISGYETIDYVLGAREGQYMNISMATDNTSSYFNILMPGEEEEAMFIGSTSGTQYEGILTQSGDYKVRVYIMRSAARRNEVANYLLEMIITDVEGSSSSDDAVVEGTNYNATGNLPCQVTQVQSTESCPFGVIREGNGTATVTVTRPDGATRSIFFQEGQAIGSDQNQGDSGEFKAERQGDLQIIYIGEESYEVPDVVIFGD